MFRAMFVLDGNKPSGTRDCALSSFTLIHKAGDSELRITSIEFSRCCTADSIAGGILRQSSGASMARVLAGSLERFSMYNHLGSNEGTSDVCADCAALLASTSRQAEEDIAAAVRFTGSLSILAFRRRFQLLKKLAECTAHV